MSDEFAALLAATTHERSHADAIKSLVASAKATVKATRERDDAIAERDEARAALEAMREQAANATNGRKGTELRPCDSNPVAVESEVGTNREATP